MKLEVCSQRNHMHQACECNVGDRICRILLTWPGLLPPWERCCAPKSGELLFEQESVLHGHAMLCRGLVEILVNYRLILAPRVVSAVHDRPFTCAKGMCRGAAVRRKAREQHVIVKSTTACYLNSLLDHENPNVYSKPAQSIRNHSSSSVTFDLASPYFCRSGIPMPVQRVKPMTMASPLPQPCVSLK